MILITILLRRFVQCSLVFIYGKNAASKCSFNWNSSWGCLSPSTKDSLLRCYPNPCKPHLHDRSNVCTLLKLLYSECFVRLGRETPFTISEQNLVNWSSVHFRQSTFCGCFGFYIHYALLRYTKAISPTMRQYCSLVNSSTRPASTVNDVVQLLRWVEVEPWDSLSTFRVETQLMKMAGIMTQMPIAAGLMLSSCPYSCNYKFSTFDQVWGERF
jgi:hypothetical protein